MLIFIITGTKQYTFFCRISIFKLFPLMSCIEEKIIVCTKRVIKLSSSDYVLYEKLDDEVCMYVCA